MGLWVFIKLRKACLSVAAAPSVQGMILEKTMMLRDSSNWKWTERKNKGLPRIQTTALMAHVEDEKQRESKAKPCSHGGSWTETIVLFNLSLLEHLNNNYFPQHRRYLIHGNVHALRHVPPHSPQAIEMAVASRTTFRSFLFALIRSCYDSISSRMG